jgi:cytochrome c556
MTSRIDARWGLLALVSVIALAAGLSCSPPERRFTEDQIKQVTSFKELMWYLATEADPSFAVAKSLDPANATVEQVARFGEVGRKLQPAAARLAEPAFSKGPDFNTRAADLVMKAKRLEVVAASKDGARTVRAILDVRVSCAACHTAFR